MVVFARFMSHSGFLLIRTIIIWIKIPGSLLSPSVGKTVGWSSVPVDYAACKYLVALWIVKNCWLYMYV
jgi:hypothetical protein